jgi:hypothetical protein
MEFASHQRELEYPVLLRIDCGLHCVSGTTGDTSWRLFPGSYTYTQRHWAVTESTTST